MATVIQQRRGTKAQHDDGAGFTGAVGEITVDTTDDTLRVHDGSLKGGHVIAKLSDVEASDTLAEMSDVNLTSPADGSVLKYDNASSKWIDSAKLTETATGIDVTGAVTVSGTVDGRDIAADGILLDAIEAGADVTDTANVVAALTAGTNITIAGDGTISSTDTNTTYSVQDGELSQNNFTNDDHDKLNEIEASADVTDTANVVAALTAGTNISIAGNGTISATDTNTTYSVQDGELSRNNFTDDDHTKLNGIEAGADVTDSTNVVAALTAGTNISIAGNGTISATDTNTTYTGGTGLTLDGTTFNVDAAQTQITSVGTLTGLTTGATTVNGVLIVNNDFMELVSTTDNATEKPVISLYRNGGAASPNDELGSVRFYGNDAGGEKSFFGGMYCEATGVADAQERGTIKFHVADGSVSGNPITDVTVDISGDLDPVLEIDALGVRANVPIKVSDVAVSIDGENQTAYRNGEIIETLRGYADGRTLTGQATTAGVARNVVLEDVTAEQVLSTTYVKVNGTELDYYPPVGAKTVLIEYQIFIGYDGSDIDPIFNHKIDVDGTVITQTQSTTRQEYRGHVYSVSEAIITVDGSGDLASGNIDNWTAAKTIKVLGREWGPNNNVALHRVRIHDGSASATIINEPKIKITAIG